MTDHPRHLQLCTPQPDLADAASGVVATTTRGWPRGAFPATVLRGWLLGSVAVMLPAAVAITTVRVAATASALVLGRLALAWRPTGDPGQLLDTTVVAADDSQGGLPTGRPRG